MRRITAFGARCTPSMTMLSRRASNLQDYQQRILEGRLNGQSSGFTEPAAVPWQLGQHSGRLRQGADADEVEKRRLPKTDVCCGRCLLACEHVPGREPRGQCSCAWQCTCGAQAGVVTQLHFADSGLSLETGPAGAPGNQAGEAVDDQLGLRLVALQCDASILISVLRSATLANEGFASNWVILDSSCSQAGAWCQ